MSIISIEYPSKFTKWIEAKSRKCVNQTPSKRLQFCRKWLFGEQNSNFHFRISKYVRVKWLFLLHFRKHRWLRPIFKISWNRDIEVDDIYAVTSGMQSEQNTEAYAKLWELELKKPNPSITRVIFRVHGYKSLAIGFLYAICNTFTK